MLGLALKPDEAAIIETPDGPIVIKMGLRNRMGHQNILIDAPSTMRILRAEIYERETGKPLPACALPRNSG
jgi:sRNA-binding carbon storage regulator CsrA